MPYQGNRAHYSALVEEAEAVLPRLPNDLWYLILEFYIAPQFLDLLQRCACVSRDFNAVAVSIIRDHLTQYRAGIVFSAVLSDIKTQLYKLTFIRFEARRQPNADLVKLPPHYTLQSPASPGRVYAAWMHENGREAMELRYYLCCRYSSVAFAKGALLISGGAAILAFFVSLFLWLGAIQCDESQFAKNASSVELDLRFFPLVKESQNDHATACINLWRLAAGGMYYTVCGIFLLTFPGCLLGFCDERDVLKSHVLGVAREMKQESLLHTRQRLRNLDSVSKSRLLIDQVDHAGYGSVDLV